MWQYANRHVERVEANAQWLEEQITAAASVSLELVNSLWYYWGAGCNSILRPADRDRVRRHIIDTLRRQLTTPDALAQVLHPSFRNVFYHLVFEPGNHEPLLAGPEYWRWLGRVLREGIQAGQITTAIGVCILVKARDGISRREPTTADPELLRAFFGDDAPEVIAGIEQLLPEINESDRAFVTDIVQSARTGLSEGENT